MERKQLQVLRVGLLFLAFSSCIAQVYDNSQTYLDGEMAGLMALRAATIGGPQQYVDAIHNPGSAATHLAMPWMGRASVVHQSLWMLLLHPAYQLHLGQKHAGSRSQETQAVITATSMESAGAAYEVARIELANMELLIQQVPEALGSLTWLSHVFLQGNHMLSGPLPQWTGLHLIALALTGMAEMNYGPLPVSWNNFGRLTDLFLGNMSITGSFPYYGAIGNVQHVTLQNISFTDPSVQLPYDWGYWYSLTNLTLKNVTGLTGGVPAQWPGGMSQLTALTISNVPGIIASLDSISAFSNSIYRMDLSSSGIQGSLPASWVTSFPSLQYLNLSGNALTGTLPAEWTNLALSQYTALDLSHNNLRGTVPDWSGKISSSSGWSLIQLQDNPQLCGPLPTWLQATGTTTAGTNLGSSCFPPAKEQSSLTVVAPPQIAVGSAVTLRLTLKDAYGTPVTSIPTDCTVRLAGATYLGCYTDYTSNLALPDWMFRSSNASQASCMAAAVAKGYKYFSLQNGDACLGGNDYNRAVMYGQSQNCNARCTGATQETCGAGGTNSVFRIGAPSAQEVSVPSFKYMGCYADQEPRALPHLADSDYMTIEVCYNLAQQNRYRYFALQYYSSCWASNDGHDAIQYGPSGGCNTYCSGSYYWPPEMCGGGWTNSLYEIHHPATFTDTVVNCTAFTSSSSSGVFEFNYTLRVEEKLATTLAFGGNTLVGTVLDVRLKPLAFDGILQLSDSGTGRVIGQDIGLLLGSNTTYTHLNSISGVWTVSLVAPNATTVPLGTMQQSSQSAGLYWWSFTVPGASITQVGVYSLVVTAPSNTGVTVFNSPLNVSVSNPPAPANTLFSVSAPAPNLGSSINMTIDLRDASNQAAQPGTACSVKIIRKST